MEFIKQFQRETIQKAGKQQMVKTMANVHIKDKIFDKKLNIPGEQDLSNQ